MAIKSVGKVAIGWAAVVVIGIGSFVISKKSIDARRYENMKIRERIKNAPVGLSHPSIVNQPSST